MIFLTSLALLIQGADKKFFGKLTPRYRVSAPEWKNASHTPSFVNYNASIYPDSSKNREKIKRCCDGCGKRCKRYFRPICGSDGKTYQSKYFMKVAACKSDSRISFWYNGKCGECNHCRLQKDPKKCLSKCCPLRCKKAKDRKRCINNCRNAYIAYMSYDM